MNPKLQEFLSHCEDKASMVQFFRLAGDLLHYLQLADDSKNLVINVTKGTSRRVSLILNSRLVLSLFPSGSMGFMLGRDFIDRHRSELRIEEEAEFTDREPIASYARFDNEFVRNNSEIFKNEWLSCCKEYLPRNVRSPYYDNNMPELMKYVEEPELILSEGIPDENDPDGKYFKDLINSLKAYLTTADNVLKEFSIERNTKRWCWISDKDRVIGDLNAHYEIYRDGRELFVDLHFEDKDTKFNFRERIGDLPKGLSWMKWQKAQSIRTDDAVDLHDEEAVKKLSDKLLYLEESIGDKVRSVLETLTHNQKNGTGMKSSPLNLILYGPPGTGKTYNSINKAISIIDPEFDLTQDRKKVKAEFDRLVSVGQIAFTTFHQSMSYEDFVEGLKPVEPETQGDPVIYNVQPGIFKMICQSALTPNQAGFDKAYEGLKNRLLQQETVELVTPDKGAKFSISLNSKNNLTLLTGTDKKDQGTLTKENIQKYLDEDQNRPSYHSGYFRAVINYLKSEFKYSDDPDALRTRNYALIIDEINRGNIAQIFGELITLIEEDKRLGNEESLEAILPYSKEKFGVPRNLYIIGTMNTADRSVEALDTALRRRFSFEEIWPNADLISNEIPEADLKAVMTTMNARIEKLLDKDHLIGHSYFMKVEDLQQLKETFHKNIIPLLQEYFYGDYGKIGLVLGSGFVERVEHNSDRIFAQFYDYESEFEGRTIYRIRNVSEMEGNEFKSALETLLKNE